MVNIYYKITNYNMTHLTWPCYSSCGGLWSRRFFALWALKLCFKKIGVDFFGHVLCQCKICSKLRTNKNLSKFYNREGSVIKRVTSSRTWLHLVKLNKTR